MNHSVLSYTFVGAWKSPLPQIPNLDRKFSLDLYNDPYNTNAGPGPEGFFISRLSGKTPFSNVLIHPQRLQITGHDILEVADIYDRVIQEILRVTNGTLPLFFSYIGINSEHDYSGLGEPAEKWLTDKFIIKGLSTKDRNFYARTYDLKFELLQNDDRKFNITLQPRNGVENSLYIAVNDHRVWNNIYCPGKKELEDLFEASLRELALSIFPVIIE